MTIIDAGYYPSIQATITAAPVGASVYIPANGYTEDITIDKPLRLLCDWPVLTGSITIQADNVSLSNLTIKGASVPYKPIYIGAVKNATIRRVTVDGSPNEAIYHDGGGENIRVLDCEIYNHTLSAIDCNDTRTVGFLARGNYCHDGGAGVHAVGHGVQIIENRFRDLSSFGVVLNDEKYVATYVQDALISNNIFNGIGKGNLVSPRYAINLVLSTQLDDGGVLVSGNVISDMHEIVGQPCYAIRAIGRVTVNNNAIRGVIGQAGEACGIAVNDDVNGRTFAFVNNNRIENVPAEKRFTYGLIVAPNSDAILQSNLIGVGAVLTAENAIVDQSNAAVREGNYLGMTPIA